MVEFFVYELSCCWFESCCYKLDLMFSMTVKRIPAVTYLKLVNETCRHFKTRIEEHVKNDNKCHNLRIDNAPQHAYIILYLLKINFNSKFDLKIKEALHINWRKPNTQQII